jgi:hypothetical protein
MSDQDFQDILNKIDEMNDEQLAVLGDLIQEVEHDRYKESDDE